MIVSDVALEKPQTKGATTSNFNQLPTNGVTSRKKISSQLGDLKQNHRFTKNVWSTIGGVMLTWQVTHAQMWSSRMTGCSKLGQEPPMAWSGTKSCQSPALYSTQFRSSYILSIVIRLRFVRSCQCEQLALAHFHGT